MPQENPSAADRDSLKSVSHDYKKKIRVAHI